MGFFSKKQENDEKEKMVNEVLSHLFKKCPICGADNFYIVDNLIEGNSSTDLSDYTNETVGVCPKCGFIGHGQVFFNESGSDKNLQFCNTNLLLLKMVIDNNLIIAQKQGIDYNEKARLMNEAMNNLIATTKSSIPEFSQKVDFVLFIKLCYEFKYKRKI